MSFGAKYRSFLVPLLLAALVIGAYGVVWKGAPYPSLDSPSYMRLATDLAGFRLTQLHQRTPGLPLVLALTGSEKHPTRRLFYLFLLLHCLSVFLLWNLLSSLNINRVLQGLFVCVAFLPPYVEAAAYPDTEALTEFALAASYVALLLWLNKWRTVYVATFALFVAAAALVRPTYQAVSVILALSVLALWKARLFSPPRQRTLAGGLVAMVGLSVAAIGSWSVLNYVHFGYFDTSTMTAINLTTKTAAFIEDLPPKWAGMRDILVRNRNRALSLTTDEHRWQDYIYLALPELREYYQYDETAMFTDLKSANLELIRERPFSYLNESLRSLGPYWMPFETPLSTGESPHLRMVWAAGQIVVVLVFLFQLFPASGALMVYLSSCLLSRFGSAWTLPPDVRRLLTAYATGIVIVMYTALVSCFMGIGISRYRVPVELLMMAVSLIGFSVWSRILRAGSQISDTSKREAMDEVLR